MINKKICILGRNKYNGGLSSTTHLLNEQISSINFGITQLINLFEIENNIEELKMFDIIFIDELITDSESNIKLIPLLDKIKNDRNRIIYINHLSWTNEKLFKIVDKILQVKPQLLKNKMKQENLQQYENKVKEYIFQVPDNFYCINKQESRYPNLIYVGKICEDKFSIKMIDFLLQNKYFKLSIHFYGELSSTNEKYNRKFNELIEMENYKYNKRISRDLLPFYYNNFKYFLLFGKDVTSIQSIEQLRCGCKVFMKQRQIDNINVVDHSNDIVFVNSPEDFIIKFDDYKRTQKYDPFEISNRNYKFSMDQFKHRILEEINSLY